MRYGSVCSGIEAATVAWDPLGWEPAFFAEIEPFPSAVLAHHWPDVTNLLDFTRIGKGEDVEPIDILVGGTPCQSFSVAGRRQGLDDPRGNLTLEFLALAGRLRPRWVVWENVPGVMSDDGGRTFGTVLGLLGKLGYGFAYRVLDAQFFGVPQRRRRVFVVGHLGAWQRAAAVLLERSCLSGNPPPRRAAGEGVAASLTHGGGSGGRGGYAGRRREDDVNLITSHDVAQPLLAKANSSHRADAESYVAILLQEVGGRQSKNQNGIGIDIGEATDVMYTLQSGQQHGVAYAPERERALTSGHGGTGRLDEQHSQNLIAHSLRADGFDASEDGTGRGTPMIAETLRANCGDGGHYDKHPFAVESMAVRRLTPRECERLQGFPDDHTAITYKGKPAADGPRYRAIGNSMAVPVMRWIGERIQVVDSA